MYVVGTATGLQAERWKNLASIPGRRKENHLFSEESRPALGPQLTAVFSGYRGIVLPWSKAAGALIAEVQKCTYTFNPHTPSWVVQRRFYRVCYSMFTTKSSIYY
jgi:hypothetical protein